MISHECTNNLPIRAFVAKYKNNRSANRTKYGNIVRKNRAYKTNYKQAVLRSTFQ